MKRYAIKLLVFCLLGLGQAHAQGSEAVQLLLNVEKLNQFKQVLDDMYKGYQTLKQGYNTVRDISSGNFFLHKVFIDGLSAVSPVVKRYHKVGDIIHYQKLILEEYRRAYRQFTGRGKFTRQEIDYLVLVYRNLLDMSARNIEELLLVVTWGKLQMSDEERMAAIDRIFQQIRDRYVFLRVFNNEATILNLQRQKQAGDLGTVKAFGP